MRSSALRFAIFLFASLPAAQGARADDAEPIPEKSMYSLFNPAPDDAMRPFDPERPCKILNPYTVDAGHFQIESDLFDYTHINFGGAGTRLFETADPVIKLGLTSSIDCQFFGY